MPTKTIQLEKPIQGHHGAITSVTLREPTGREFIQLGEPRSMSKAPDGSIKFAEDFAVVKGYLERCVDVGGAVAQIVLNNGTLRDMLALRDGVLSFFDEAVTSPPPSASLPSI